MTENVTLATFKIFADSQKQLQAQSLTMQENLLSQLSREISTISADQKQMSAQLTDIVTLLKDDITATKSIFERHIIQYANDREQIDIRFTNLFKRQDKIDKILLQRQSMWMVYKGLSWVAKIFIIAVITAIAASLVKLAFM